MAESVIQKQGKAAFLVKAYSGTYSLGANAADSIRGNAVGYTSIPSGYTPVAFKAYNTSNNNTSVRYMQADGYSTRTLLVVRNISASAITNADVSVEILFVRSDLFGT